MSSIDVLVPSYQYGRYLRGCVESVLSQDIAAVRVLIIDNASTDNSVEVAQQLAAEDRRVEVLARRTNLGPHASFNEGVDWARSELFMVLCADDLVAPGAFKRALAVMQSYPGVGLAYGQTQWFHGSEPPPTAYSGHPAAWTVQQGRHALKMICRRAHFPMALCATMTRTSVLKKAGYFRPALPHTEDWELWLRMMRLADVASTDAVQGVSRVHGEARSAFLQKDWLESILLNKTTFDFFFTEQAAGLNDGPRLHRAAQRGTAAEAYWAAIVCCYHGDRAAGRKLMTYALSSHPDMRILPPFDYLLWRPEMLGRAGRALSRVSKRLRLAPAALATGIGLLRSRLAPP